MDADLLSVVLLRQKPSAQSGLPLAADSVMRYVWESRFGAVLIEVKGDMAYVNGEAVERTPSVEPV